MENSINLGVIMNKAGFLLCIRGKGTLLINGKPFVLTRGMGAVVSPLFLITVGECDDNFQLLPMLSKLEYMVNNAQKVFSSSFPIMALQHPVVAVGEEDMGWILTKKKELEDLEQLKNKNKDSVILTRIFEQASIQLMSATFMTLIGKYYSDYIKDYNRESSTGYWQLVSQFLMSVIAPNNNERRVGWYAEQAHLSVGHFSATIRKVLGMSPQQWIEMITVNKAKSLLQQRDKSIKEIAQELGFPEQFTFRKYFKEHAGMSPTEYRTLKN